MEPIGFISSKRFILKGNLWDITFISGEKARIFVPEGQQANGQRFKYYFDAQYVDISVVGWLYCRAMSKPGGDIARRGVAGW